MENREHKIVVYCCENSGYKAYQAAEAGSTLKDIEIIPLPCSGKIEMGIILKSIEIGYAGVLILGCPQDNCTFIRGNYRAEKRIQLMQDSLKRAGISPDIVRIDFLSSVDTHKFIRIIEEMKEQVLKEEGAKA